MGITLEKIKGMNIQVGTPIEVEWKCKMNNETYTDIGYFQGFTGYSTKGGKISVREIVIISRNSTKPELGNISDRREINDIQNIKRLDYKK